jgi:cell division protein FtsW (lipid II flippase)
MYPLLQPHQRARVDAMIAQMRGDDRYADDIGYQGDRSVMLAGSGGVLGVGADHARDLIVHNHLPEEHNDMIFAVVTCRWGLLGALMTWGLFLMFCFGALLVAGACKDPFGKLVAVGIPALIFAQVTINTGMTIGVLPITGMTLPFVSYGGSSLIVCWLMVGLLLNIAMRRPEHLWRKSFEFDNVEPESS